ncbi:hypothetical protein MHC_02185 [Mycoplasma haemocanis str. Illinois]|uniref:Uncharacterized protein n=1 Tax=Mycoplasma haemocanis (strain Illinois) TaxID=1111676 RepID=H6N6N1_MYCHN|nr:hypothetical protein [Mycoplasma haemocanis]AEW45303.1 hypothetical protein MHC_02185 [Mycoplasma haemocanis str. Illinois]
MEFTSFKLMGVLGTTAVTSAGVYGVYHFSGGSNLTVKDHLLSTLAGQKVFIGDYSQRSSFKVKYDSFQRKPKKDDKDLPFDQLELWCKEKSAVGYYGSNVQLNSDIETYCFFNVKTLLQELKGRVLKSDKGESDQEWVTAWKHYNTKKVEMKLEVKTSDNKLNGSTDSEGGKALYVWCTETANKKMYEADSLLPAFKEWCTK